MITLLVQAGVLAPGQQVRLDDPERHHLRVRRAREGEVVRLLDGMGGTAEGTIAGNPSEGLIQVHSHSVTPRPARRGLAVAAGDRDRFGWLVEKAAELGVTDLVPLETERTGGVGTRVRESHIERLQRRGLEAIKQSGAPWAPLLHPPVDLPGFLDRELEGVRWLADGDGAAPPSVAGTEPAWTVVGPEGGFTGEERTRILQAGWWPVKLGAHILRFETAAVVAAVMMSLATRDS
jgi:16S rRNA (uracil1498-N3)-methyltransferase